jgi:superfamily I DNA/RNA helicase
LIGGIGFYSIDFGKIDDGDEHSTWSFSDFAILYRTKNQGKIIADVLLKAGIPCQVASREEALYKKGLAELVSVLKVIEGWGSYPDFESIIRCIVIDIDAKPVAKFTAWGVENGWNLSQALHNVRRFPIRGMKVKDQKKFNELAVTLNEIRKQIQVMQTEEKVSYIIKNPFLTFTEDRRQHLKDAYRDIIGIFSKFGVRESENRTKIELESDTDFYNPLSEKVTLLTMHAAKGLEFPVVFIAGCEKGFVPFHGFGDKPVDIDEERRLFYVALTRARERLFLSYAKKRVIYGKTVTRKLSPFVKDIKKQLTQRETPIALTTKAEMPIQMKLF